MGVRLTWTASEDAISGVKNYAVYRKAGDPPFTSADIIDQTTGTGGAYSVAGRVSRDESAFSDTDAVVLSASTIDYTVVAIDRVGLISAPAGPVRAGLIPPPMPVYRFYNIRTGVHFYTASEAEKSSVVARLGTIYRLEGVAFYVGN